MVGETTFERYAKQIAVVMVALLVLLPVYWMVNMSFKERGRVRCPAADARRRSSPTTENYYDLLVTQRFYLKGINSLVVAIIAATHRRDGRHARRLRAVPLPLAAKFNYHLLFTILTVRMFPPIVTVIPLFAFYNREILRLQAATIPSSGSGSSTASWSCRSCSG